MWPIGWILAQFGTHGVPADIICLQVEALSGAQAVLKKSRCQRTPVFFAVKLFHDAITFRISS